MATAMKTSLAGRPADQTRIGTQASAEVQTGLRARISRNVVGLKLSPEDAARRAIAEASKDELAAFCSGSALMLARNVLRASVRQAEVEVLRSEAKGASFSEALRPLDRKLYALPNGTLTAVPLEDWTIEQHELRAKWFETQAKGHQRSASLHRRIAALLRNEGVERISELRARPKKTAREMLAEAAA